MLTYLIGLLCLVAGLFAEFIVGSIMVYILWWMWGERYSPSNMMAASII